MRWRAGVPFFSVSGSDFVEKYSGLELQELEVYLTKHKK
jgi:ATP-dependent Zn protease